MRTGPSGGALRVPASLAGASSGRKGVRGSRPVRACGLGRHPRAVLEQASVRLRALARRTVRGGLCPVPVAGTAAASPETPPGPGDYAPAELAVFACDFGLEPRPGLPSLSDCPGAVAPRPRTACGSAVDLRDRLRLREALLAQRALSGVWAAAAVLNESAGYGSPTVLCYVPPSRGWAGILRPARRAGPSPSRPAGSSRSRWQGPLYTVRRDLDGHGTRRPRRDEGTLAPGPRGPSRPPSGL